MRRLRGAGAGAVSLLLVSVLAVIALMATSDAWPANADPHAGQSVDVAIIDGPGVINGGTFPTTGAAGGLGDFNFSNLAVADVNAANLGSFDTVLLNVASSGIGCNLAKLSAGQLSDLVDFAAAGNKLIIYDSECTFGGAVDYSWLPFPFTTNNPGAAGAQGTVNIVEENTLSTTGAADPHFIDAAVLGSNTDAIGDMNVMVTLDPNWCLDMSGTNINEVTGPVHAYARFGTVGSVGLIIYNGMDVDFLESGSTPDSTTGAGNLAKIWLQELQQPFNPSSLPCGVPVAGISLTPETATNDIGTSHTVTATITDLLGKRTADVDVSFEVTDGPNAGDSAMDTTDANGEATFTYTGDGGTGTDTIQACFLNEQEQEVCDTATKEWVEPAPTPTPTPTVLAATATPTPAPTPVALPASGGTPSDGGSSALPWLAAIAGAIALIGSGSAWLAHQRRRVR